VRAILRRVVQLVIVLVVVTFLTAAVLEFLPGDPVTTLVPFGSDEMRARVREETGLDRPMPVRYWEWVTGFARGDLGQIYNVSTTRPVYDEVKPAVGVSLQLVVLSQIIALAIALPIGVFAAYKAGTRFDRISNAAAFGLLAVPNFVLAVVLAYYLGVKLGWLPVSGYRAFGDDPKEWLRHLGLPALSLAAGQIAIYMRLLRSDMIATLQEDFILMAKAKGVSAQRVLWRHALRPSSLTLLTVAGLNVGALIGGALIIEVIFQLPGIGLLLYQAIGARQYIEVQSIVALIAVAYVVVNFAVDILYTVLDPRIRHARALA
jgi:peptide/nickel transport system permease protein